MGLLFFERTYGSGLSLDGDKVLLRLDMRCELSTDLIRHEAGGLSTASLRHEAGHCFFFHLDSGQIRLIQCFQILKPPFSGVANYLRFGQNWLVRL